MGSVIFTATRSLLVASGTLVSLDVGFGAFTRSYRRRGSTSVSLNGDRENILQNIEARASVATTFHDLASKPAIDQWIQSVLNGERFTLDRLGSVATPVDPLQVEMVTETFTEAALVKDKYRLSFDVVIV